MPIIRIPPGNAETFTLVTRPTRTYSSSSVGPTGSVAVFARNSSILKESEPVPNFTWNPFSHLTEEQLRLKNIAKTLNRDYISADFKSTTGNPEGGLLYEINPMPDDGITVEALREHIAKDAANGVTSIQTGVNHMLKMINSSSQSPRASKKMDVHRFTPGVRLSKNSNAKSTVRKNLMPFYRRSYDSMNWAYTNYHSLNFFTGSNVPSDSVLIYNALSGSETAHGVGTNRYCPTTGFTFEFHINPRYTTDFAGDDFHAGTILHMSSCFAISLVSGSSKTVDGVPDAFRVMLQLSHSADISPSEIALTASNNAYLKSDYYTSVPEGDKGDLIFLSSDNALKKNHWHHVALSWAPGYNNNTGSIYIDGTINSSFYLPSASVTNANLAKNSIAPTKSGSNALFVGNFWQGANETGTNAMIERFFNAAASDKRGLTQFNSYRSTGNPASLFESDPLDFQFAHPLNAEMHNIKIYNTHRDIAQIVTSSRRGARLIEEDLLFHLPPFFVRESPKREILQTPFMTLSSSFKAHTEEPFNVPMSFGVGGHLINLENFCREFVSGSYPLLYALTGSEHAATTSPIAANDMLYKPHALYGSTVAKRNLTILPCDDGTYVPNYSILISGSKAEKEQQVKTSQRLDRHYAQISDYDIVVRDYATLNYQSQIPACLAAGHLQDVGSDELVPVNKHDPMVPFVDDKGLVNLSLITLNSMVSDPLLPAELTSESSIGPKQQLQVTSSFVGKVDLIGSPEPNHPSYNSNYGNFVNEGDPKYEQATWVGEVDENGDPKVIMNETGITEMSNMLFTATPEDPSMPGFVAGNKTEGFGPTGSLAIYNRTRDSSSNQVTFFDISNLFYGDRIIPGSFNIVDTNITGSYGKIGMRLKDNGLGSLYRADCETPHATWNNVGNIFYYDGLVCVKSPHLYFYGKENYSLDLTGEHRKYVYQVHVPCPKGLVNSSSNPEFRKLMPSDYVTDAGKSFVYITGINLHDENMNVVAKASLAQPVVKRPEDHFLFKLKIDY